VHPRQHSQQWERISHGPMWEGRGMGVARPDHRGGRSLPTVTRHLHPESGEGRVAHIEHRRAMPCGAFWTAYRKHV